jgi:retron-type reverse transcriptase
MRRTRIDPAAVADYANLADAALKAARGKRAQTEVRAFFAHFDAYLARLADAIQTGNVPLGSYRCFQIHDPKPRLIHAPSFPDRVIHHALLNRMAETFERTEVASSYACRPGKGVLAAGRAAQHAIRRFPWYVKIDIRGYFNHIDHAILLRLLARRFKGRDGLALLARIIESYYTQPGLGLPIGTLTSQHFANFYLDGLDRFLLETLRVQAHARYMDDILWWCESRSVAKAQLDAVRVFARKHRRLEIKPNPQTNRSARGVTFCGFRILPGALRLSRRRRSCYQLGRNHWEVAWQRGEITALELQSAYAALHSIVAHGDTRGWRREQLLYFPAPEV